MGSHYTHQFHTYGSHNPQDSNHHQHESNIHQHKSNTAHEIQTRTAQKQYNPQSSNTITTKAIYNSRFHTCNSCSPRDSNNQHKSNPSQDSKRSKTNTQHKLKKKTLATVKMTGWLQAIWSDKSETSNVNEAWVMTDDGETSSEGWRWRVESADDRRVRPRDDCA